MQYYRNKCNIINLVNKILVSGMEKNFEKKIVMIINCRESQFNLETSLKTGRL